MKRRHAGWLFPGLLALLLGCAPDEQVVPHAGIERVEVLPAEKTIVTGEKFELEVRAYTNQGRLVEDVQPTFESSAPEVAFVSQDGVVEGLRPGSATIFAEVSGKRGSMKLQVRDPVRRVEIRPDPVEMLTEEEIQLEAIAYDEHGKPVEGRTFTWRVENTRVAEVDESGVLRSKRREEETQVFARTGDIEGSARVIVRKRVASIEITPKNPEVREGKTVKLTATVRDDGGVPIERPVEWSSADPEVATIDENGELFGVRPGETEVSASSGGMTATVPVKVLPKRVHRVEVDPDYAELVVGETLQYTVRLYGEDGEELFDRPLRWEISEIGARDDRYARTAATVDETGLLRARRPIDGKLTVTVEGDAVSGEAEFRIVLRMQAVSAGVHHTCGLAGEAAWCWGRNEAGETGRSDLSSDDLPAPVDTGELDLRFRVVAAGHRHSCGLTERGEAWCWGDNERGQLGIGMLGGRHHTPQKVVSVVGAEGFAALFVGADYSCGLNDLGEAFCWGRNDAGQLGVGHHEDSPVPVRVASAVDGTEVKFRTLSLGKNPIGTSEVPWDPEVPEIQHNITCGISLDGDAYCWGKNEIHAAGIGAGPSPLYSAQPVKVAGGVQFASISVGRTHVCALTDEGQAYCWGTGSVGELGDGQSGSGQYRLAPHPVLTEARYAHVAAGDEFNFALTAEGALDFWGRMLIPGSTGSALEPSVVPYRVAEDERWVFTNVSSGRGHFCGVDDEGVIWCWGWNSNQQLALNSALLFVTEPTPVFPETPADHFK
nr:MAG: hypothetical protein DIU72_10040 [Pseudomonadota bacterium]